MLTISRLTTVHYVAYSNNKCTNWVAIEYKKGNLKN